MADVEDITPAHEPVSLIREMLDRAPGAVAAFCVLVDEDGTIWRNSCGHRKQEVLWACVKTMFDLMEDD